MYTLIKRRGKIKSDNIIELLGYETKLNKETIIIYNQYLIDVFIKSKLMPDFDKLTKKILLFINESDDSDDAVFLLDELARLYTLYLNKYEKYLSAKEKRTFMKRMHVLSNELKHIARTKKIIEVKHSRMR